MCEQCEFLSIDGFRVCKFCGESTRELDPRIFTFNHVPPSSRRDYSRKKRFMRLLLNLQGLQYVDHSVFENLPSFKTPQELAAYLKTQKNLRRHRPKLPSIWYQLGNRWPLFSDKEQLRAAFEFDQIKHKVSYLVLLPYICKKIGRSDVLCFCKPVSESMQKKYEKYLVR